MDRSILFFLRIKTENNDLINLIKTQLLNLVIKMKKYFIHNGQSEIGPFDIDDLIKLKINSTTPIWHEGLQNWTTASNLSELNSIFQNTIVPPPFEGLKNNPTNVPAFNDNAQNTIKTEKKKRSLWKKLLYGILIVFSLLGLYEFLLSFDRYTPNHNQENYSSTYSSDYEQLERDRINAELTKKNRNYRNNINDYVTSSTNQYTSDLFGGITNLDITVTNNTEYTLDNVTVAVDYIKDNGDIFKTEYVTFYNIPANQDKSISAPDSERGTSVNTKIESVYSKKMHICYDSNVIPNTGDIDPYFCKK